MRMAANVSINAEDRPTLERWPRGRSTPARLMLRANIVLKAAAGMANIRPLRFAIRIIIGLAASLSPPSLAPIALLPWLPASLYYPMG